MYINESRNLVKKQYTGDRELWTVRQEAQAKKNLLEEGSLGGKKS
jgi:hypothetical protein